MSDSCTVVIGAADLLPSLKERIGSGGEVLVFTDFETPKALEVIMLRRPRTVALERVFAATSRGAALLARLKSDPTLSELEIRVIAHDSDYVRIARGAPIAAPASVPASALQAGAPEIVARSPLDYRGTRRAPRHQIAGRLEVLLDGNPATLVDLSQIGAQVMSATILRPNQRVRVALPDEIGLIRFNATVTWAHFELQRGGQATPQYRAGIEFTDANRSALEAFIARHAEPADHL